VDHPRHAHLVDLGESLVGQVLRKRRLACPVVFASGTASQVRLREEGGAALRGPFASNFDATDFETCQVLYDLQPRKRGARPPWQ
jgi:hypothetical protein